MVCEQLHSTLLTESLSCISCRMEDLIPILLQYVKSRQKPGGYIMFVAHNARTFDVPFLIKEFSRHSYEIPPNWLFMDTLSLARELIKSGGQSIPPSLSHPLSMHVLCACWHKVNVRMHS